MPSPDPMHAPSVDPAEVARYQRLAATWWDPQGPFWPLHVLNRVRSGWIVEQLARELGRDASAAMPLHGLSMLDVGCGGGILSESVARNGAEVLGIDVTARNIVVARDHADGQGLAIRYRQVALEDLDEGDFDVVLNMEVIEHVVDPQAFLRECLSRVRPGGFLVLATLNRTLASFAAGIIGAEYLFRLLPRGTHQWHRFVRPKELTDPLEAASCRIVARSGVGVNPFTRRMRLIRYEGVNYMLMARIPAAS
ncbi:3-demethylubiquinone-9 3-methyltransferase [Thioalkalivibrio nitratireducens DSM 14787]|uniref:Ubiquinone biosynthesis O-methyltransferase n=1 Tax=Thioalkalivibrio nitratireducens (strain DSM 14787 / UNIQEM 213 / ALEN2) TaxID=1255043 RepID=L0DU15_THIND|nr:bifunctional 2-polyprenyl-6-hydroxyphenol methylase/3-demethylubiquinol 3-O-methyltransferase UbiG [Thioalkalivibrio nitratireducens]AGA33084.1 3-demethylubiquinone-9 3-methyltransferase [Thioalkalivibrio nitratireducens DSM 14787]